LVGGVFASLEITTWFFSKLLVYVFQLFIWITQGRILRYQLQFQLRQVTLCRPLLPTRQTGDV